MGFTKDILSCYQNFVNTEDEIYSDISVEVEDKIFPCHRFVLAACSPYFRGLFRFPSDEQEKKRNSVKLKDVSSEAFGIIYGFLYYHENKLNKDNFLDVWKAADFLQIDFICSACRKIGTETINKSNYQQYSFHVRLLDKTFMPKIFKFITNNFDQYKDSDCVMEIEGEELMSIVRDPYLKTSREENVVDTILKWVNYSFNNTCLLNATELKNQDVESRPDDTESVTVPSDSNSSRTDFLVPLLTLSRLTSLDEDYLNSLLQHPIIVGNKRACDLITMATMEKMRKFGYRYSYRPTFACHRRCNRLEDVVLMPNGSGKVAVFIFMERIRNVFIDSPELPSWTVLTVHKEQLYACGYMNSNENSLSVFFLMDDLWQEVIKLRVDDSLPSQLSLTRKNNLWSFSIGEYLYVVDALRRNIFQFDPVCHTDLKLMTPVPTDMPLVYVTFFKSLVLVICSSPNDTAMLNIYDTSTQQWAATVPLVGVHAQNIVSFYKEDKLYFLTSDYKLYILESVEGGVTLKHLTTFPKIKESLMGAVVYCEDLFIFAHEKSTRNHFWEFHRNLFKFPRHFNNVRVFVTENQCTSLVIASNIAKATDH